MASMHYRQNNIHLRNKIHMFQSTLNNKSLLNMQYTKMLKNHKCIHYCTYILNIPAQYQSVKLVYQGT